MLKHQPQHRREKQVKFGYKVKQRRGHALDHAELDQIEQREFDLIVSGLVSRYSTKELLDLVS